MTCAYKYVSNTQVFTNLRMLQINCAEVGEYAEQLGNSRWESQYGFDQPCMYENQIHHSAYQHNMCETNSGLMCPPFERKDSVGFLASKHVDSAMVYSYSCQEQMNHPAVSRVADQFAFTEFELPSNVDSNNSVVLTGRTSSFDRSVSLLSNNIPVSLPELVHRNTSSNAGQNRGRSDENYCSDSSCSSSSKSTISFRKDSISSASETALDDEDFRMTRVDWRWAALKGFWDKDKKCWIESAGGQAAYIQQRMQRVQVRKQRLARQAKAMQRLVPVQNTPFRSGLVEELPYQLDHDPWTDFAPKRITSNQIPPVSKSSAPSWFDRDSDNGGNRIAAAGVSVQVFPFDRSDTAPLISSTGPLLQNQQAASAGPAPKWFETVYATPAPAPLVQESSWNAGAENWFNGSGPDQRYSGFSQQPTTVQQRAGSWW